MFGEDEDGAPEELGNVVLSKTCFVASKGCVTWGLPGRYFRVGGSAGIYLLKGEEAGSDSESAVGEHSSEKCTLERFGQTSFYFRARTGRWQKHFLSATELKQGC